MSLQGVLVLNLIALALLLWVLNLVRHGRLYVGYGVIFVIAALGTTLLVSVPWLQATLTHVIGAVFPVSALTLLALCFIVLMLLYTLTQLTIVSNRLSKLVQELAIERAKRGGDAR
jgi:drug/metabolite transporter superfamily protein YnfA